MSTLAHVPSSARRQENPCFLGRLRTVARRAVPTAGVIAVLISLAAWGHYAEWRVPKFSTIVGGIPKVNEQWCEAHNVREAACIECNPAAFSGEQSFGWCKEHGVPNCPLEHPEVAQVASPPVITAEDLARAEKALATRPRAENNSRCQSQSHHIQFASAEAMDKAGIDIAVVEQRQLTEAITAYGEVIYDQNRTAHLSSRAAGTVWRVEKNVGDRVHKGDIVALVDATEVGRAKADLIQSITQRRLRQENLNRLRPLEQTGAVPLKSIREAEAACEEAKVRVLANQQTLINLGLAVDAKDFDGLAAEAMSERIQFLGLPSYFVAAIERSTTSSNLLPITSPVDGTVVERHVVAGEVVQAALPLFTIADTSTMWLMLAVRQEDAPHVKAGQTVRFEPSDRSHAGVIQGTVGWMSTAADDRTRMVSVRVGLDNRDGRLRANTFGTGKIVLREEPAAIVVPSAAIHSDGDCSIVFVRDKRWFDERAPKFFHVRKVRLGVAENGQSEVIAGLLPGEVVASKNSNLLEAQLLKAKLGDGCGCTH